MINLWRPRYGSLQLSYCTDAGGMIVNLVAGNELAPLIRDDGFWCFCFGVGQNGWRKWLKLASLVVRKVGFAYQVYITYILQLAFGVVVKWGRLLGFSASCLAVRSYAASTAVVTAFHPQLGVNLVYMPVVYVRICVRVINCWNIQ